MDESANDGGDLQQVASHEEILKLAGQLSRSADYLPQIAQIKKELKDQLVLLKKQIKKLELDKQNTRISNENLHQNSHLLKQKALTTRYETWTAENKVKTLYRKLQQTTSERDKKQIEVKSLRTKVEQEKKACTDLAALRQRIRTTLVKLRKERDWYKREANEQERRANQIETRTSNLKEANAHLKFDDFSEERSIFAKFQNE